MGTLPFVQLFAPRPSGELNRLIPKSNDGIALARLHVAPSLSFSSSPLPLFLHFILYSARLKQNEKKGEAY